MSLRILSEFIEVSEASLAALGVKCVGTEWHFPERDATGEIIGWQRRLSFGKKLMVPGSKRGLCMVWPLPAEAGTSEDHPVLIVEGASDTAAGLDLGLTTIGRPSALGGAELLQAVVKDRHVVIIGENDNGAGRMGAEKIATALLEVAESVKVIYPPEGAKDLREWRNAPAQLTREELQIIIARADHWTPTVKPIDDPAPPRLEWKPFPVDELPEPLRSLVALGAAAMGCDPAYLAMPVLAVCASAIGTSRVIEVKPGWKEPAVLWCVSIGHSGTMKTPPMDVAMEPLRVMEHRAYAEHLDAMKRHADDLNGYQSSLKEWERKGLKAGDPRPMAPTEPICRRFTASDTTIEALATLLTSNPRGLLLARDELAGWVASFDQYRGSKGGDSAKWLEMHRANPLQVDRKTGEPRSIRVERAAVSICGTIQPAVMSRAMGREHFDSGLVARMLLAFPPRRRKRWTDDSLPPEIADAYGKMVMRLAELQPTVDSSGVVSPMLVRFDARAQSAFVAFFEEHAERQNVASDEDFAAALAKHENLPARLALIFHQVRVAAGEPGLDPSTVDAKSVSAAIRLARWFGHETERVYHAMSEGDVASDRNRLVDIIRTRGGSITARELIRNHPRYPTAAMGRSALNELVDAGLGSWQIDAPGPQGGPPTRRFVLTTLPTHDTTDT